jgi:hypothetical protein
MPKGDNNQKVDDETFVRVWMEAYQNNERQTGVIARLAAMGLPINSSTVSKRAASLKKIGVDLPRLRFAVINKQLHFTEDYISMLNNIIYDARAKTPLKPERFFPCGHPKDKANTYTPRNSCRRCLANKSNQWRKQHKKEKQDAQL